MIAAAVPEGELADEGPGALGPAHRAAEHVWPPGDAAHAQFGDEKSQGGADHQPPPSPASGQRPQLDAADTRRAGRRWVSATIFIHCDNVHWSLTFIIYTTIKITREFKNVSVTVGAAQNNAALTGGIDWGRSIV